MFFTIRAGCGYESLHDGLGLGQMEQDPSGAVEADSVIKKGMNHFRVTCPEGS